MLHLFAGDQIHQEYDQEGDDHHDPHPDSGSQVIPVLDDHGDLLGNGAGPSRDIPRQHGRGPVLAERPGKGQDRAGCNARPGSRHDHRPEDPEIRHSQRPSRIDQVHIDLFHGRSCIPVHKRKSDDRGCDHAAQPGLHHFKIKLIKQE